MYDLDRLEYGKVLEILQEYCISKCSKKKLMALRPGSSRETVAASFNLLRDLIKSIGMGYPPRINRINDMSDFLRRAKAPKSSLSPEELVQIGDNISTLIALKHQYEPIKKEIPLLALKVGSIRIPFKLKERIDRAIDEHGNPRDDASPRLYEIGNKLRNLRLTIETILQGYLHSSETKHYLQERHITLKDNRYVIPLKQNFKGRIQGIIHAQSGSEKTVFLEPFSIVDHNNEIKLLNREREKEVNRILISLTGAVREKSAALAELQDVLSDIDILLAKHAFMDTFRCTVPEFCDKREIEIEGGRHPLLKGTIVPVDFRVKEPINGVVITGPNMGGKTVTLKMIGLFVLMAQSGIPVPAGRMCTFPFSSVYSDIGDEGSIEQSLSTFSGHIKNIKTFTHNADKQSLVLIDELGAGTDPVEGGALGAAILDYLIERNVLTVVTTHFSFIKLYALGNEKTEVASVEFDSETCLPTYRLVMGIPGRSNALEIAGHLGLERRILERTRNYLSEEDRVIDGIFRRLALMERELSSREERVSDEEETLNRMIGEYTRRLGKVEEREIALRAEYKKELSSLISHYRKQLENTIREVREGGGSKQSIIAAKAEIGGVDEEFSEIIKSIGDGERNNKKDGEGMVAIGDTAAIMSEDGGRVRGKIVDIRGEKVTVLSGNVRFTVLRDHVHRIESEAGEKKRPGYTWGYTPVDKGETACECDIRGLRYEEAMAEVVKFLDNAVLNNTRIVSIIHGLGTGVLREGVWETLKNCRDVDHFEYARPEQGGFGCTIVSMKS